METALVRQLSSPCVKHPHGPAWQEISKPLQSQHVALLPPSWEVGTHKHPVSEELMCKPWANPTLQTRSRSTTSHLWREMPRFNMEHAALHAGGKRCKRNCFWTPVPVFINLLSSLSGNLHVTPAMGVCALAADSFAHCCRVPAIPNSSLMWHSQGSLPSHSQMVLTLPWLVYSCSVSARGFKQKKTKVTQLLFFLHFFRRENELMLSAIATRIILVLVM